MREIVSWCDGCVKHGKRTPIVETYVVSIRKGKGSETVRTVEVCAECENTMVGPVYVLIGVGIVPVATQPELPAPEKVRDGGRRIICPLTDCGKPMWSNSLPAHFAAKHGVPAQSHPVQCPDCTFTNKSRQAMGLHRVVKHGWDIAVHYKTAYDALHTSRRPVKRPVRLRKA